MQGQEIDSYTNRLTKWVSKDSINKIVEVFSKSHKDYIVKKHPTDEIYAMFVPVERRKMKDRRESKKIGSLYDLAIICLASKREGISVFKIIKNRFGTRF